MSWTVRYSDAVRDDSGAATEIIPDGAFLGSNSYPLRWTGRDLILFALLATLTLGSPRTERRAENLDSRQANRDGNSTDAATADQPKQSAKDRELARKIRRAIVTDKSLSMYAHNVRIIAENGVITLKGRVRSEKEKSTVTAKAAQIAGAGKVQDELTNK